MRNQRLGHKRNFPINGRRMNADPLWVQSDDVRSDVTPFMWFWSLPLCRNSSGTFSKTFHLSTNHKNDLLPTRMNFAMMDGCMQVAVLWQNIWTELRKFLYSQHLSNMSQQNSCRSSTRSNYIVARCRRRRGMCGDEFMIGRNWILVV